MVSDYLHEVLFLFFQGTFPPWFWHFTLLLICSILTLALILEKLVVLLCLFAFRAHPHLNLSLLHSLGFFCDV